MIYLAIRYLLERRKQTIFTLLGVFLGALAYVAVTGFFTGFQTFMIQQLVNNSAQIHIEARQDYLTEHQLDEAFYNQEFRYVFWRSPPSGVHGYLGIQNPQSWYERLKADPRVEAFAPLLTAPALFTLAKVSVSANLVGCDPKQQGKVTSIANYMIEGEFSDIGAGGNRIILGDELMKRLGAGIDQTLLVAVKTGLPVPFKVVGRFRTGNRGSDTQAYGALNDVQKLNGTPNQVNEIGVRLSDYTQAAAIATNWSRIAPERTESWDQQNASILSVIRLQTILSWTMTMTVIIVAGFGIYNILNMTVTQKRQDIAILRSMGYDTYDVVVLFFSQGIIIGICGGLLGLVCGYFLCLYLQTIPFSGGSSYDPQAHLQISLSPGIYVQALFLSLFSSSFASILPALAASRFTPIQIIRSGA